MMFIYAILAAVGSVVAGILIAVRTKREPHVIYGKLEKAGQITNILLGLVYLRLVPGCVILGALSEPRHEGVLGVLGVLVGIVIASGVLPCGLGLGCSVALRKKGKSKLSFAVQFAGLAGMGIAVALYAVFAGNLLITLN